MDRPEIEKCLYNRNKTCNHGECKVHADNGFYSDKCHVGVRNSAIRECNTYVEQKMKEWPTIVKEAIQAYNNLFPTLDPKTPSQAEYIASYLKERMGEYNGI